MRIGSARIDIRDGFTEIRFPQGDSVCGLHHGPAGQKETARQLGLSVERMNRGHDVVHCLLAKWVGLDGRSPTLFAIANKWVLDKELNEAEEAAVLAIQRYMRLLGIDPESLV